MIWMDVDAALAEVPVNVCPLIDDGDFKSIESSVAYNAAGMALTWHFVTTAGASTATAVTPTSGGDYDWAHQAQGMYTIEMPATGGVSANNDTEGYGYFTGVATGVLPWRGPTIGFRAAGLNNALVDSAYSATLGLAGSNLDAAITTRMASYTQPTGFLAATFPGGTIANTTNITAGTIATVTNLTNLPATAALEATLTAMKGATFDGATDSLEALRNRGDSAWVTATGFATSADLATLQSHGDSTWVTATGFSTFDNTSDTVIVGTNNDKTGYTLSATGSAALTEGYAAVGAAPTLGQILYEMRALAAEKSISGATLTTLKLDGSTTAATYTLDDATTPSAITRAT